MTLVTLLAVLDVMDDMEEKEADATGALTDGDEEKKTPTAPLAETESFTREPQTTISPKMRFRNGNERLLGHLLRREPSDDCDATTSLLTADVESIADERADFLSSPPIRFTPSTLESPSSDTLVVTSSTEQTSTDDDLNSSILSRQSVV